MSEGIKVMLDKERTLKFTISSFQAMARELGVSPEKLPATFKQAGVNPHIVLVIFWGGLLDQDPTLSFQDFTALLSEHCGQPFFYDEELLCKVWAALAELMAKVQEITGGTPFTEIDKSRRVH